MLVINIIGFGLLMAALAATGLNLVPRAGTAEERRTFRFAFIGLALIGFVAFAAVAYHDDALNDQIADLSTQVNNQQNEIANLNATLAQRGGGKAARGAQVSLGSNSSPVSADDQRLANAAYAYAVQLQNFMNQFRAQEARQTNLNGSLNLMKSTETTYVRQFGPTGARYYAELVKRLPPAIAAGFPVHPSGFAPEPGFWFTDAAAKQPPELIMLAKNVYPEAHP